nr:hypothetical protein [candidate division Zixibacteria bacterium]
MTDEKKYLGQFEVIRDIVMTSYAGGDVSDAANKVLKQVTELVGLSAGTLILWDKDNKPVLTVSHAKNESDRLILDELEKELFSGLRDSRNLVSAYLSFGGEDPSATFTLPLKRGRTVFGAVIGIQKGSESLIGHDKFLETLAAGLSAVFLLSQSEESLEKEKLEVLLATATTVNHEINNPLQAILGIVQLLPKDWPNLDEKLIMKLGVIEESALAIMKVTHRLMNISEVEFDKYISNVKMIKLPEDTDSS